ncbi:MAG: hypothetical protein GY834_17195 [Bacteroidetes bacterium]|nr:hypothetical protein [Bacteroidota bacterium]
MKIEKDGRLSVLKDFVSENESLDDLREFIQKLKLEHLCFGQELSVLLAEPLSFNLIRNSKVYDLDDLRKESNKIFNSKTQAKFQNININENSYNVAYGYSANAVEDITQILLDEKVFAINYFPVSGFLLSELHKSARMPKGTLWSIGSISVFIGLTSDSDLIYYEITGEFSIDEKQLLSDKCDILFDDISFETFRKGSLFKKQNDIFSIKEPISHQVKRLSLVIGSCKLLFSICLLLVICFAAIALIAHYEKSSSEEQYLKYEDKLINISSLKRKIDSIDDELSNFEDGIVNTRTLSSGISMFCQRVPKGIVLDEIYSERSDKKTVHFSTQGKADKESAVFTYRDYINSSFGYECMNIQSIGKERTQRSPIDTPKYTFTIAGK